MHVLSLYYGMGRMRKGCSPDGENCSSSGYCSHASPCEAFFVSAAQRKSQKTREKRRQTAFYAVCVHRGACYWAQPGGGVNSNQFRKEALIMKRHFLPHAACALFLGVCLALLPGMQTDPALAQEAAVMSSSAAG